MGGIFNCKLSYYSTFTLNFTQELFHFTFIFGESIDNFDKSTLYPILQLPPFSAYYFGSGPPPLSENQMFGPMMMTYEVEVRTAVMALFAVMSFVLETSCAIGNDITC